MTVCIQRYSSYLNCEMFLFEHTFQFRVVGRLAHCVPSTWRWTWIGEMSHESSGPRHIFTASYCLFVCLFFVSQTCGMYAVWTAVLHRGGSWSVDPSPVSFAWRSHITQTDPGLYFQRVEKRLLQGDIRIASHPNVNVSLELITLLLLAVSKQMCQMSNVVFVFCFYSDLVALLTL